jgi:cytosine/adenosine deaminase-related metal-dependent hydrolase
VAVTGPGWVNAHTHVYSGLAPFGLPPPAEPPRDFLEILGRVWWRLDRALDAPALRAAARWYVADALLHGTTTLIDHHESPCFIDGSLDVIADACDELGIRALLCYGATERNDGRREAGRGLAECARFVRSNRRRQIRGLVGVHASFTVSDETLGEAAQLCADLGVPSHVHVAEDLADVADARRRGASGPLERLRAAGALPPGSILAHGVHLDDARVQSANAGRLWLVQNPRSNRGNRVGYPLALAAGERVALGTDGYPSDMRAELAALLEIAGTREPGTTPAALERRLAAGAELVRERFGEGALDADVVETAPSPSGAAKAPVDRVVVAGRVVVRAGRLVSGDLAEIRTHAEEHAGRLWARMETV